MSAEPTSPTAATTQLKRTPLYGLHVELGARMVPFASYEMPVQYANGVLKEHLWTREKSGLFDVSHMGQCQLSAPSDKDNAINVGSAIERLVPAAISTLDDGRMRYSQLLGNDGGILDDLMISRIGVEGGREWYFLVVNGACKVNDFSHIEKNIDPAVRLDVLDKQALLALQGPASAQALTTLIPGADALAFMSIKLFADTPFGKVWVSRSGYTGEDGFEISLEADHADALARALLGDDRVKPVGLGARDSLRLEAGLCLYGHDIDETTSPIEAGLAWSIQRRRRSEGGFPGAERIQRELADGPARRRVGIKPEGRAPAREGTKILDEAGAEIGIVTSGGFGPSAGGPVAMGYVTANFAEPGTKLQLVVRGKAMPAQVAPLPFVPHRYFRKS